MFYVIYLVLGEIIALQVDGAPNLVVLPFRQLQQSFDEHWNDASNPHIHYNVDNNQPRVLWYIFFHGPKHIGTKSTAGLLARPMVSIT
jgi:hypothetical protein